MFFSLLDWGYGFWGASLVAQWLRICLPVQETRVRSSSWEDPLEKEMATHSSILAWRIPMHREAWWGTVCGVAKESDTTQQLNNNNGFWEEDHRSKIHFYSFLLFKSSFTSYLPLPLPKCC